VVNRAQYKSRVDFFTWKALTELQQLHPVWRIGKVTPFDDFILYGPNGEKVSALLTDTMDQIYRVDVEFPRNKYVVEYDGMHPRRPFETISFYHPLTWNTIRETIEEGNIATKTLRKLSNRINSEGHKEFKRVMAALTKLSKTLTDAGVDNNIHEYYLRSMVMIDALPDHFTYSQRSYHRMENYRCLECFSSCESIVQWVKGAIPIEIAAKEQAAKEQEKYDTEHAEEDKEREIAYIKERKAELTETLAKLDQELRELENPLTTKEK
jgi:hypothetical protein